jgi:hypothetical protein
VRAGSFYESLNCDTVGPPRRVHTSRDSLRVAFVNKGRDVRSTAGASTDLYPRVIDVDSSRVPLPLTLPPAVRHRAPATRHGNQGRQRPARREGRGARKALSFETTVEGGGRRAAPRKSSTRGEPVPRSYLPKTKLKMESRIFIFCSCCMRACACRRWAHSVRTRAHAAAADYRRLPRPRLGRRS